MPSDAQIRFADQVVLIRAPRMTFAYAGADQVWQPNWRDQPQLPSMLRVAVRDGAMSLGSIGAARWFRAMRWRAR